MKIKLYYLERMTRWELFQFTYDTIDVAHKHEEGMPQSYAEKLEELCKAFEVYDKELAQTRIPLPASQQLIEAADNRDYAIRKLYQLARYYADYRYDATKQNAGRGLKAIFRSYGTGSFISRQAQDVQTAMITNLLQELERDTAQQHLSILNLTEVVAALDQNNRIFEKEQQARRKKEAKYVTGLARDARIALQNQIMEFTTLINALAVVEGEEKYAKLKQIIGSMIKKYMTAVRQRTKKREDDTTSDVS